VFEIVYLSGRAAFEHLFPTAGFEGAKMAEYSGVSDRIFDGSLRERLPVSWHRRRGSDAVIEMQGHAYALALGKKIWSTRF
jgi:hypothetical protein